jgi:hypothetical protein
MTPQDIFSVLIAGVFIGALGVLFLISNKRK